MLRDPRAVARSRKAIHPTMTDDELVSNITSMCQLQASFNPVFCRRSRLTLFLDGKSFCLCVTWKLLFNFIRRNKFKTIWRSCWHFQVFRSQNESRSRYMDNCQYQKGTKFRRTTGIKEPSQTGARNGYERLKHFARNKIAFSLVQIGRNLRIRR